MTSFSAPLSPSPLPRATEPVARGDFPTWLPAMLVKELRQGLRTRGFVGGFIVFQVIMMFVMLGTVVGSMFGTGTTRAVMTTTISGFFWALLGAQLLLATPGRALGSLQTELESRSLDLLVLTRLTAWRIVLGKWVSLMAQGGLLFVAMLPYGIVRYFMGSVDLVQDATICAAMLGGCALLTAAALAGSGLPKVVRILVPVVVILGFQMTAFMPFVMGRSGGKMSSFISFGSSTADAVSLWINGALLLGIFLVAAVRRIAPAAENHGGVTRGLALLTLVPVPLWAWVGRTSMAVNQLKFAAVVLGLIGAFELASMRWPMAAHWRSWAARGAFGRLAGRFTLPGWPSALCFAVLATALLALGCGLLLDSMAGPRTAWLAVLGLTAVLFPAVVLSFFSGSGKSPGGFYFIVFGVGSLIAAVAAILSANTGLYHITWPRECAQMLPVAGWWLTLFQPAAPAANVIIGQVTTAAITLVLAWWQSRFYWEQVAKIDTRVRASKA